MADTETQDEHGRVAEAVARPGSDGEHALQQRLGTGRRADRFYDEQVLDHLNARMQEFIRTQEMFFLATADRHGECDNSFRAGPPGFLQVLDERTLLFPEYRGNGVHASLGNLQENPHAGLLLVDFLRARIGLHVNGTAEVWEDADIRARHPGLPVDPVPGRRAVLWVRVTVEEAYIHCAKHIPHLQKAPKGTARDWGTDDYRRKGGDFFGAARDARERGPVERPPREHGAPGPEATPVPALPAQGPPQGLPEQDRPHAAEAPAPNPQAPQAPQAPVPQTPAAPAVPPMPATAPPMPPAAPPQQPAAAPTAGSAPATGAVAGASAAIAARSSIPEGEAAEAWRQEAERALAEAERRAAEDAAAPFQGWFAAPGRS